MGIKTGGKRGRPSKPVALKILQGNPGKRPLSKEITATDKKPSCPSFLDKEARKEWKRLVGSLYDAKILTASEQAMFAAYCQTWSRWVAAEKKIQAIDELVVKTKNGHPMPNPYLFVANKAMEQMRGFANELGLTPTSRQRINPAGSSTPDNPFQMFLDRGKKR